MARRRGQGWSILVLYIVLVSTTPWEIGAEDSDEASEPKKDDRSKCGVYLAPSTIPGAGMGMFAGHYEYEPGDFVTDSDLVIPLFEMDWHNGHETYPFLWDEYVWSAAMFEGMDQETEDIDGMTVCSGGMGAAVNCRLNLVNTEDAEDTFHLSMSGVSSESPGAGAFTPYIGRRFQASKPIVAGMELYVSYGDNYFSTRDAYNTVPLRESYKEADKFLERYNNFKAQNKALSDPEKGDKLAEALWNFVIDELPLKSRTTYALPKNVTSIPHVLATGGTAQVDYNSTIVSLEWLEEHGQCMDNIMDGVSTIPDAGRGAFARRFIPKDALVAPAPLIHLGNRSRLTMFDALPVDHDNEVKRDTEKPVHYQLLLNYCFGHRQSSLLLCPYGLLTALINHSPNPNAKLVWSKNQRHNEWLHKPHMVWNREKHTGLAFDFVALRDIEEGEEVFIDYGSEWDEAWQKHATDYDVPRQDYHPAFELNLHPDIRLKTIYEADYEEIDGIYTFCRKTFVDIALGQQDAIAEEAGIEMEVFDAAGEGCYPCRIVDRNDTMNHYTAEIFFRDGEDHESGMWEVKNDQVRYVLFDVPKDAFFFHDAPYSRDHHQQWTFRHDMRIPDDMFPDVWKDLPEGHSHFDL